MQWTFGIITDGTQDDRLQIVLTSIRNQHVPEHEIIVVGNTALTGSDLKVLTFDESIKEGWITKKKNMIVNEAKYENVALMHDYLTLDPEWYANFEKFGDDWDVCMNRMVNPNGQRYRDWVSWAPIRHIPYDNHDHMEHMYVSGAYFCVKKSFYQDNPLDESIVWGMGEDVEWSLRIRNKWNYRCNPDSVVRLLKHKAPQCHPYSPHGLSSRCLPEYPFQKL